MFDCWDTVVRLMRKTIISFVHCERYFFSALKQLSVNQPLLYTAGFFAHDDFKSHGSGLHRGEADFIGPVKLYRERISRLNRVRSRTILVKNSP